MFLRTCGLLGRTSKTMWYRVAESASRCRSHWVFKSWWFILIRHSNVPVQSRHWTPWLNSGTNCHFSSSHVEEHPTIEVSFTIWKLPFWIFTHMQALLLPHRIYITRYIRDAYTQRSSRDGTHSSIWLPTILLRSSLQPASTSLNSGRVPHQHATTSHQYHETNKSLHFPEAIARRRKFILEREKQRWYHPAANLIGSIPVFGVIIHVRSASHVPPTNNAQNVGGKWLIMDGWIANCYGKWWEVEKGGEYDVLSILHWKPLRPKDRVIPCARFRCFVGISSWLGCRYT